MGTDGTFTCHLLPPGSPTTQKSPHVIADTVDAYTAAEAGRVLKVSPKRVHQFVEEDRLDVVGRSPLRVSQVSVLQLQKERETAAQESEGTPRSAGASRRSHHPQTPSVELVPLLTSAFDRVQAADARTLEEHGLRMTAEAEARFLRDALHEARAGQTHAEQELAEARARVVHLEVIEAEVERLRAELKAVRPEGEAPTSSEAPREGPVGGPEGQTSDPHAEEVTQLREELAAAKAREQAQDAQWAHFRAVAAEAAPRMQRSVERAEAIGAAYQEQQREALRASAPAPAPAPAEGLFGRLFRRR